MKLNGVGRHSGLAVVEVPEGDTERSFHFKPKARVGVGKWPGGEPNAWEASHDPAH
jgi:hypothetical protein